MDDDRLIAIFREHMLRCGYGAFVIGVSAPVLRSALAQWRKESEAQPAQATAK